MNHALDSELGHIYAQIPLFSYPESFFHLAFEKINCVDQRVPGVIGEHKKYTFSVLDLYQFSEILLAVQQKMIQIRAEGGAARNVMLRLHQQWSGDYHPSFGESS
jgi:hypothetical protein